MLESSPPLYFMEFFAFVNTAVVLFSAVPDRRCYLRGAAVLRIFSHCGVGLGAGW